MQINLIMAREDLRYDMARHVVSTVYMLDE